MSFRSRPESSLSSGASCKMRDNSSHLRSNPDATTPLACFSKPSRMRISACNSSGVCEAVARSTSSSSSRSCSSAVRSSSSSGGISNVSASSFRPRSPSFSSRNRFSSLSCRRLSDWKIASGLDASRRCKAVRAKPTDPFLCPPSASALPISVLT